MERWNLYGIHHSLESAQARLRCELVVMRRTCPRPFIDGPPECWGYPFCVCGNLMEAIARINDAKRDLTLAAVLMGTENTQPEDEPCA